MAGTGAAETACREPGLHRVVRTGTDPMPVYASTLLAWLGVAAWGRLA